MKKLDVLDWMAVSIMFEVLLLACIVASHNTATSGVLTWVFLTTAFVLNAVSMLTRGIVFRDKLGNKFPRPSVNRLLKRVVKNWAIGSVCAFALFAGSIFPPQKPILLAVFGGLTLLLVYRNQLAALQDLLPLSPTDPHSNNGMHLVNNKSEPADENKRSIEGDLAKLDFIEREDCKRGMNQIFRRLRSFKKNDNRNIFIITDGDSFNETH